MADAEERGRDHPGAAVTDRHQREGEQDRTPELETELAMVREERDRLREECDRLRTERDRVITRYERLLERARRESRDEERDAPAGESLRLRLARLLGLR